MTNKYYPALVLNIFHTYYSSIWLLKWLCNVTRCRHFQTYLNVLNWGIQDIEVHFTKPGKHPGGTGRWQAHSQSQRKASWYIGKAMAMKTRFADLGQSVLGGHELRSNRTTSSALTNHVNSQTTVSSVWVASLMSSLTFGSCEYRQVSQAGYIIIFQFQPTRIFKRTFPMRLKTQTGLL